MAKRDKSPAIYKITNKKNGRVYIGSTGDITQRFKQYITAVNTVEKDPSKADRYNDLISDMVKFGWDNFDFKILDATPEMFDNMTRAIREIEYITKYRSIMPEYGYNASMGGETGSVQHRSFNTGKPKDIILVDTQDNYSAWLYLRGTLTIHKELGLAKMTIPDALRRGGFTKGRYFLFFANTEHREAVAEFVRLKRDLVKSNGKNDNAAKEQYKMYLKALEAANECAEMFGY